MRKLSILLGIVLVSNVYAQDLDLKDWQGTYNAVCYKEGRSNEINLEQKIIWNEIAKTLTYNNDTKNIYALDVFSNINKGMKKIFDRNDDGGCGYIFSTTTYKNNKLEKKERSIGMLGCIGIPTMFGSESYSLQKISYDKVLYTYRYNSSEPAYICEMVKAHN